MTINERNTHIFDSVPEFCNKMESIVSAHRFPVSSITNAIAQARIGNAAHVPAAEKVLAQIADHADLATLAPTWQKCIAGAYPHVPDFLAGDPECMRKLHRQKDSSAPVKIWFCTSMSIGTTGEQQVARGIAALALAMALEQTRPTELLVYDPNPSCNVAIRLRTTPLDLSEACHALTDQNFVRYMQYQYIRCVGHQVEWPRGLNLTNLNQPGVHAQNEKVLRRCLGTTETDVVLVPSIYGDNNAFEKPVEWLIARLAEYKAAHDDE